MVAFGTRPEAIKMAPVIQALRSFPERVRLRVCVTAQHREMLDQVLELFHIKPDLDLNLMQPDQPLSEFCARALVSMTEVLKREKPDLVLVQGDTTTTLATALSAFYLKISVGHVEAGLRTHNRYYPFPEEINRRIVGTLSTYHFAPTPTAKASLLAEGVAPESIFLTGNTVVDALQWILHQPPSEEALELLSSLGVRSEEKIRTSRLTKLILVTAHRRESFGRPFESICKGLLAIAERNPEVLIVYPVHLNPNVRKPVLRYLSGHPRIRLIEPLPYEPFVRLLNVAYLVLTDSGGIQEEASVLGKPVLVLRAETERPEVIESGVGKLVGTKKEVIVNETERLLGDAQAYSQMAQRKTLFGDGKAAERIAHILLEVN